MSETRKSIVERLDKLEACHKNIVSLEKDVAFLQRDLWREQRENAELKTEVSTLRMKVSQMEGEMKEVSTLRRKVSTMEGEMEKNERRTSERISQIQNISEVLNRVLVKAHENVDWRQEVMGSMQKLQLDYKTSHHHTERRLDKLETDCARNRQSVSDKIGNVETRVVKRLEEVEDIVKTQSRKVSKLVEEFETRRPEESLSAQACAPPPTQSTPTQSTPTPNTPTPSTPTPSTPTPSTPPAPSAKNLTPEERKRLIERSRFDVRMSHPRTIQGRTRQRVEEYDDVATDGGFFDRKTGVYKTPVFGQYGFGVTRLTSMSRFVLGGWTSTMSRWLLPSSNDGDVRYYLCGGDGRRKEVFVSRASDESWQWKDVDWDCPEGLEVWVEVEAGRGGDGLTYQVDFEGCLTK